MSEFIGSRISLVSRSDIRYVGTLHEINSENSTVALEQVVSFGTEGRRNSPDDEIAPSDSVYEYIVFRGSDVKDLRIEEAPKETKQPQPQVPDDPAILGSGSRPSQNPSQPQALASGPQQQPQPQQQQQQPPQGPRQPPHPSFPHQQQYPFYYPPPPGQRFGPQGGPPPGPGFPGMPYGAPPPGWFPPPGQGFPQHPGGFPGQQPPFGPPGQQQQSQPQDKSPNQQQPGPLGPTPGDEPKALKQPTQEGHGVGKSGEAATPTPAAGGQRGPPPPNDTKPDVATALAPPANAGGQPQAAPKPAASGPKNGRIVPALPLQSPNPKASTAANGLWQQQQQQQKKSDNAGQQSKPQQNQVVANAALQNATQAATAAVAAAMAKLPPAPGKKGPQNNGAVDNLTQKVNEMRTNDGIRSSRQPGTGGYVASHRGGRARGGSNQNRKVDVPTTDYDFESANAKFSKQDLIKEAIATGSPAGTPEETPAKNGLNGLNGAAEDNSSKETDNVVIPPPAPYNKSTSFFDNISSESRDREDPEGRRPGGREWRGEEQKKNLETFGQGSVDNGYRGGYRGRGRGRGRGFGYRGRGGAPGNTGGRGGFRAGRGDTQNVATATSATT
ncbi:MAG: hypothetical protein M4579_002370 [Chaenotheca gracillima]|nr:MAG: hypothetical protein M4579_002370 [Chaenotheca gracillima]